MNNRIVSIEKKLNRPKYHRHRLDIIINVNPWVDFKRFFLRNLLCQSMRYGAKVVEKQRNLICNLKRKPSVFLSHSFKLTNFKLN